ncbi:MAG: serine/threonine protein kinase [Chloroflexota bacterium]|nr:serine/threonine protein kinase [Chloroflexota bacterium]
MSTVAPPPRVVADHYQIEREKPIGSGGMALVYRGRDLRTRRDVALKTLKPEFLRDSAARARFRHEARTMAFLTHPNVARVYDLFEPDEVSPPWAVIEFVPGNSLRQEIDQVGPIDIDRIVHLLKQMAAALDHLHKRGMVHLDVKPHNILFAEPMTVKLIDFGIAQRAWTVPEQINGQAYGTVAYVSPEQASGEVVGPPSDIYSLGCVVYEMVTGRAPFAGESSATAVIEAHLNEDPLPPSEARPDLDLPEWIDDVVLDALRKDPEYRYTTTVGFADAFEASLNAANPPDSTVPLGDLPRFDPRRNPVVVADPTPVPAVSRKRPPLVTRIPTALLWRLCAILAVGNLLLAGLSFFENGRIPGVYTSIPGLADATQVTVDADLLNVRADASNNAEILTALPEGSRLEVVGPIRDGWLPIEFEEDGETVTGFVSIDHVDALPLPGRDRLRDVVDGWLP